MQYLFYSLATAGLREFAVPIAYVSCSLISQLLENSQLALMDERRGWNAIFTLWAIIAHPTSPFYQNSTQELTWKFLVTLTDTYSYTLHARFVLQISAEQKLMKKWINSHKLTLYETIEVTLWVLPFLQRVLKPSQKKEGQKMF